ncbi:MAG TPA: MBL fold metallo-hydrolase [Chitinophagaceae bacterium]|nr:MBL fold metallo-hydrolase [Chitinophagaceae bacterium]
MKRRQFIRNATLTTALMTLTSKELLARFYADPWKIKMLRNDIGIFTERGGTIGFMLSKKGAVIVDTEFPDQAKHLISELKARSDKPFNLLINTHHHGDHTAGNIEFKGLVPHVVGHENCLANHKRVAESQKNADKQLFADVTFTDTWKKKVGSEKIKAHYFGAAHTNGDAIIHFQHANVAHMGDLVFNRRYAFIDRSAGANVKSWIQVLDKTLRTFDDQTIFIFGHAFDPEKVTGNKEDIKAMQNYLAKLLQYVEGEIKSGKTKEEIVKAKSIPGVTEWQGDGIERGLTAAYEELTETK